MEYYLAIKRKKIMIHATMWMKLINMALSERARHERSHCVIPFTGNIQNRPIHRDRKNISGFQGQGG